MPSHGIKRGMIDIACIEFAAPFHREAAGRLLIFEGCNRRLEIARVRQAIGANRSPVRQGKFWAVILPQIPARRAVLDLDLEFDAARDQADFARGDPDPPKFREEVKPPELRNDEKLA